jgi:hypothetical protein
LDEEQTRKVWRMILDNSFPRMAVCGNEADLALFASIGEHAYLQRIVSTQIDPGVWLIPVPRTIYELAAISLYVLDRSETAFAPLDPVTSEMNFIEPFFFDHKTTVQKVTSELLLTQVTKAMDKESLWKSAWNLQQILFASLVRLRGTSDASIQPMRSILDLELDEDCLVAKPDEIDAWFDVSLESWLELADIFLNDLCSIQMGVDSEISRKFDRWPLTSPFLQDVLGSSDTDNMNLPMEVLTELKADLSLLHAQIVENTPLSLGEATVTLKRIQEMCIKDEREALYGKLCGVLCPELVSIESMPEALRFSELKRLVALLDVTRRTDPCISVLRHPGVFAQREMILKVVQDDFDRNRGYDVIFLFRGSLDLSHESLSSMEHTTSPSTYGLELGSSTDYETQMQSNPCRAHSMSFGSSLFAGLLYDPTAAVWTYWASEKIGLGYYLEFPITKHFLTRIAKDLHNPAITNASSSSNPSTITHNSSVNHITTPTGPSDPSDWWFIPPIPTLLSLAGSGELWHSRTKCSIPSDHLEDSFHFVSGILSCSYRRVPAFLLEDSGRTPPNFASLPIKIVKSNK